MITRAVLAIVLAVPLTACAGEAARTDLPIADDFSGDCDGWSKDDDGHIALGCDGGAYQAVFERTDERLHHYIPRRVEEPSDRVSVEADVTLHAFPGGTDDGFEAQGVGCWSSGFGTPAQGYSFLVAPAAHAIAIVKQDETDERLGEQFYFRALLDEEADAVAPVGGTNRLRGECRASGDGVELTMYLDGRQVGAATDPRGFSRFEAFGFIVMSTEVGTDVRFDNFEAAELDDGS